MHLIKKYFQKRQSIIIIEQRQRKILIYITRVKSCSIEAIVHISTLTRIFPEIQK